MVIHRLLAPCENLHPPSTLTPLICVRCIFCSRDRESATRIFLHPSLSMIFGKPEETVRRFEQSLWILSVVTVKHRLQKKYLT